MQSLYEVSKCIQFQEKLTLFKSLKFMSFITKTVFLSLKYYQHKHWIFLSFFIEWVHNSHRLPLFVEIYRQYLKYQLKSSYIFSLFYLLFSCFDFWGNALKEKQSQELHFFNTDHIFETSVSLKYVLLVNLVKALK